MKIVHKFIPRDIPLVFAGIACCIMARFFHKDMPAFLIVGVLFLMAFLLRHMVHAIDVFMGMKEGEDSSKLLTIAKFTTFSILFCILTVVFLIVIKDIAISTT